MFSDLFFGALLFRLNIPYAAIVGEFGKAPALEVEILNHSEMTYICFTVYCWLV